MRSAQPTRPSFVAHARCYSELGRNGTNLSAIAREYGTWIIKAATRSPHAAQRNAGERSSMTPIPGLRCAPSRLQIPDQISWMSRNRVLIKCHSRPAPYASHACKSSSAMQKLPRLSVAERPGVYGSPIGDAKDARCSLCRFRHGSGDGWPSGLGGFVSNFTTQRTIICVVYRHHKSFKIPMAATPNENW